MIHLSVKLTQDGEVVLGMETSCDSIEDAANVVRFMADAMDVRVRALAAREARRRRSTCPFSWALEGAP